MQPAATIYNVLSNFNNFTPLAAGKVDNWQATEDTCSFNFKGFGVKLRMIDKEFPKLIKITGDEGNPMKFNFWLQLVSVEEADTRMRIVLEADLNMMMNMLVGNKLQDAVELIADKIAESFNSIPVNH